MQLLIGPVVSGASVVTDPEIVKDVLENQHREVLAIEMEIYGMYYAASWAINPRPRFIALKAISDFADSKKGDQFINMLLIQVQKYFKCWRQDILNMRNSEQILIMYY